MQVVLIFLSFFIILYWILQLAGVNFIKPVAPFFEGIKAITHIFYKRIVQMNGIAIDFSFLIATLVILLFVLALKPIIEYIEFAEKKYDVIRDYLKKKKEILFNIALEKQYLKDEYKNNKFLLLVKFSASDLSKDKFFDKKTGNECKEKQKEILKEFSGILEGKLKFQKRFRDESILLCFYNFNDIDEILSYIENTIKDFKIKYNKQQWHIDSFIGIDVYKNAKEIDSKTEKLIKLINLGLANNIVCLATFKQRYALVKKPKYKVEAQGIYKIFENEDVFCVILNYKNNLTR